MKYEEAVNTVLAARSNPSTRNIYLVGPPRSGKTHLRKELGLQNDRRVIEAQNEPDHCDVNDIVIRLDGPAPGRNEAGPTPHNPYETEPSPLDKLACYLGFEGPTSISMVCDEAYKVLNLLQIDEVEWNGVEPLRVGHIVEGGTVEAVGIGEYCVRTNTGGLEVLAEHEVKPRNPIAPEHRDIIDSYISKGVISLCTN